MKTKTKEEKREISKLWITGTIAFALLLGIILSASVFQGASSVIISNYRLVKGGVKNNVF